MESIQDQERKIKRLAEGRTAALTGFFILLVGASALIGFSVPLNNPFMLQNGGFVLLASPVFLTIAVAIRRKLKRMGIRTR